MLISCQQCERLVIHGDTSAVPPSLSVVSSPRQQLCSERANCLRRPLRDTHAPAPATRRHRRFRTRDGPSDKARATFFFLAAAGVSGSNPRSGRGVGALPGRADSINCEPGDKNIPKENGTFSTSADLLILPVTESFNASDPFHVCMKFLNN